MKTIKKLGLVSAVAFAMLAFSACDDSSSASSDETGTSSSSVETSDLDESSSSVDKKSSGNESTEKDKSSSSKKTTASSSALSTDSKKSSSSGKSGSSSSQTYRRCQEGTIDTLFEENEIIYRCCKNDMWRIDSIVKLEQSKVYPDMDSVFGSEAVYGTFTDLRNNKVYKTTKYYDRVDGKEYRFTVMAQNLNYAEITIDSTTKVFDDSKIEKRCYKDDPWYCDNYFGALYSWSEAMGLPKVCDSVGVADNPKCSADFGNRVQGVCPEGWHVMNEIEWKHFAYYNGIDMSYTLLSHAVWPQKKGHNSYGMSILPYGDEEPYLNQTLFWIPEEEEDKALRGKRILVNLSGFSVSSSEKKGYRYIRCVLDEGDSFLN
jgi:uncharacterized protein (TIGR02145 family)